MKAYVIIRVEIDDPTLLKDYQAVAPAIIAQYHGNIIVRGGAITSFEGPADTRRTIIIEFSSMSNAEKFYQSPEYTYACKLREGIGSFEIMGIEGVG